MQFVEATLACEDIIMIIRHYMGRFCDLSFLFTLFFLFCFLLCTSICIIITVDYSSYSNDKSIIYIKSCMCSVRNSKMFLAIVLLTILNISLLVSLARSLQSGNVTDLPPPPFILMTVGWGISTTSDSLTCLTIKTIALMLGM